MKLQKYDMLVKKLHQDKLVTMVKTCNATLMLGRFLKVEKKHQSKFQKHQF